MNAPDAARLAVIIEDDPDVRHLLKTVLTQSGFETILTTNGMDGIEAVRAYDPVLTTLDVSMPGMDGFAVARRLREFSSTYIIMLTALAEEIDIVQGLESGADDYLLKPFRPRELRARIETVLRRPRVRVQADGVTATGEEGVWTRPDASVDPQVASPVVEPAIPSPVAQPYPGAPVPQVAPGDVLTARGQATPAVVSGHEGVPGEGVLRHRGLAVDRSTRVATVDGANVELTRSEFDLLATLMQSGRRVRSKADLVLMLRGEHYVTRYYVTDADKRAVEVHVANLRRKIGDSSATPTYIETVRGVGYRMTTT